MSEKTITKVYGAFKEDPTLNEEGDGIFQLRFENCWLDSERASENLAYRVLLRVRLSALRKLRDELNSLALPDDA